MISSSTLIADLTVAQAFELFLVFATVYELLLTTTDMLTNFIIKKLLKKRGKENED